MFGRLKSFGEKYGWGSVIAGTPYVNGLAVITVGLAVYFVCLVFSMFGVYPEPPEQTMNPISWILYLVCNVVFGWFLWSYMTSGLMFLMGAAWSLADLIYAQANKSEERFRGAVAGLCLTLVPISLWYRHQPETDAAFAHMVSVTTMLVHHIR